MTNVRPRAVSRHPGNGAPEVPVLADFKSAIVAHAREGETMTQPDTTARALADPDRLDELRRVALLDTPAEEAFDRYTRLASTAVGAPISLVTLVDAHRQFFKSCVGLAEPWATARETPLSHSFCQHAVAARTPLLIEDARTIPLVRDNLAVHDFNVVAYLGVPLITSSGQALGSFCVIDTRPRIWTDEEISLVTDLASQVVAEIEQRLDQISSEKAGDQSGSSQLNSTRARSA